MASSTLMPEDEKKSYAQLKLHLMVRSRRNCFTCHLATPNEISSGPFSENRSRFYSSASPQTLRIILIHLTMANISFRYVSDDSTLDLSASGNVGGTGIRVVSAMTGDDICAFQLPMTAVVRDVKQQMLEDDDDYMYELRTGYAIYKWKLFSGPEELEDTTSLSSLRKCNDDTDPIVLGCAKVQACAHYVVFQYAMSRPMFM